MGASTVCVRVKRLGKDDHTTQPNASVCLLVSGDVSHRRCVGAAVPLSPIPAHPNSLLSLRGITCPIIPPQSLALKTKSLSVLLGDLEARSPPLCTHNQKKKRSRLRRRQ